MESYFLIQYTEVTNDWKVDEIKQTFSKFITAQLKTCWQLCMQRL